MTKIKYLFVLDKLYEVTDMSFTKLSIEATETNLKIKNVPPDEVFDIEMLSDFRIKLKNLGGQIINIEEWKKCHQK